MPKKNEAPASFEKALSELEQIVTRLESGDLPLEEALNEFERGVQLARQGQAKLQQAEQRVEFCCLNAICYLLHRTMSNGLSAATRSLR